MGFVDYFGLTLGALVTAFGLYCCVDAFRSYREAVRENADRRSR